MGRGTNDLFADIMGQKRGPQGYDAQRVQEINELITIVTQGELEQWIGVYQGQRELWQGPINYLEVELIFRQLGLPVTVLDKDEEGIGTPNTALLPDKIGRPSGASPLTVVTSEIWVGIYLEGKLLDQGVKEEIDLVEIFEECRPVYDLKFQVLEAEENGILQDEAPYFPRQLPYQLLETY